MARYKFNLEQFVIEVATAKVYFVLGTPLNCKVQSNGEPGYVISNRQGNTLLLTQKEMEGGAFVLRKDNDPAI